MSPAPLLQLQKTCLAALSLGFIATNLFGCAEQEMQMNLNYACQVEGSNGCEQWAQTGTSGTKDEADAFKVDIGYTCMAYSDKGYCKTWSQAGKAVKEAASGSCFPGSALVLTRNGPMAMSKVKVGDELLGMDRATGNIVSSKVRAFLHREAEMETEMTVLLTTAGRVVVSPKHSIATERGYVFASDLKIGDSLLASPTLEFPWTRHGTRVTLLKKTVENVQGLYSPFTTTSNYFAGDSESSMVLAHNFAHVHAALLGLYSPILHRIFDIAEFFNPRLHDLHEDAKPYVHPIAQRLQPIYKFVGIYI